MYGKQNEKNYSLCRDVKHPIMEKIRQGSIKMKHPFVFIVEELGLRSALFVLVLAGAFSFSVILYLLKKTGALEFLSFGFPGIFVFLKILPYDYIALLLIAILVGSYILKKLDVSRAFGFFHIAPTVFLLLLISAIGLFFLKSGIEQTNKGIRESKLPEDALHGKVLDMSENTVTIEEENGKIYKIIFDNNVFERKFESAKNKFLWAIGEKDKKDDSLFRAKKINCCYE